jgi:hypothetical protein
MNPTYLTITNFIQNSNNLIKCWENRKTKSNEIYLLIAFKILLCNTFLTNPMSSKHRRTFRVDRQNHIKLCCWYKNIYNTPQLNKLKQMGLLLEIEGDQILVAQTRQQFYDKIKTDMLSEPIQKLLISPNIDELIMYILDSIIEDKECNDLLKLLD